MKISVSLPDADVEYLDRFARQHDEVSSRSAALRYAVKTLRSLELGEAYQDAWEQWRRSEGDDWDAALDDGVGDAAS